MTSSLTAADILETTLQELAQHHNGFSGNCARVAQVLDEVLDTGGDYVVVGEHYEFADHVFLRWNNQLWDMNGAHTEDQARAQWCQAEEEDEGAPHARGLPRPGWRPGWAVGGHQ